MKAKRMFKDIGYEIKKGYEFLRVVFHDFGKLSSFLYA